MYSFLILFFWEIWSYTRECPFSLPASCVVDSSWQPNILIHREVLTSFVSYKTFRQLDGHSFITKDPIGLPPFCPAWPNCMDGTCIDVSIVLNHQPQIFEFFNLLEWLPTPDVPTGFQCLYVTPLIWALSSGKTCIEGSVFPPISKDSPPILRRGMNWGQRCDVHLLWYSWPWSWHEKILMQPGTSTKLTHNYKVNHNMWEIPVLCCWRSRGKDLEWITIGK